MLGKRILAAPVVTKNTCERRVIVPEGIWLREDGSQIFGPCEVVEQVSMKRLVYYMLQN